MSIGAGGNWFLNRLRGFMLGLSTWTCRRHESVSRVPLIVEGIGSVASYQALHESCGSAVCDVANIHSSVGSLIIMEFWVDIIQVVYKGTAIRIAAFSD